MTGGLYAAQPPPPPQALSSVAAAGSVACLSPPHLPLLPLPPFPSTYHPLAAAVAAKHSVVALHDATAAAQEIAPDPSESCSAAVSSAGNVAASPPPDRAPKAPPLNYSTVLAPAVLLQCP